jgi:hypothetical protein
MSTVSATIIAAVLYRLRQSSEPLPAYDRLRAALVERYQSHPHLITGLNSVEKHPSVKRRQTALKTSLKASGASADAAILSLASEVLTELQHVAGGSELLAELAQALAQSEQERERFRRARQRQPQQQPQPEDLQRQLEEWSQRAGESPRQREEWQEDLQRQQEDLQRRQIQFQRQQRSYEWSPESDRPTPAQGSLPGRVNLPPPVPPRPPTGEDDQEG